MTNNEAKDQLKQGNKITHEYFMSHEYIHLLHGVEYFEDGVKVPLNWWNKEYLQDGWRVYEDIS